MFVTTSRNSNIFSKRFCKYLSIYLPGIKYIPRGKSSLKNIFEKATYLGQKYFLEVSLNETNILLSIFSFKKDSFYLEREYLIEVIDLRHSLTFSKITSFNNPVNDLKKVFYFLEKKNISLKSDYGLFLTEKENVFEFLKKEKYLGFKFKILNVKIFDW